MAPIRYSLHYETYSEHIMSRFGKLLQTQSLVDMTLMCSSHTLRVHKAVLSASSAYFQEVLQKQSGEPLIILKMRFSVLKCLVEFMYCGKTQCLEENMDELVSAAQFLKIKGLSKVTKEGLGITSTGELPIFTPPVVINRPPQSLIDLHSKDVIESKSPPAQSSTSSQLVENPKKDMVLRIPFDIESGGNNTVDYADPAQFIRPRRGRPSFRRPVSSGSWENNNEFGRATERALLRREQDSRKAIHQLKHLQTRHMQDYIDRVTLSQAVNSICDPDSSKQNFMNIENDLIYMDQTMSSDVLNPSIPYTKDHTFTNETITSSYSASTTINDTSNGDISNAMSQYVNALKNAGLPTDLPILFESGDGSYMNVNEQVLLDMVQSSEIQYEVIEQPNLMEKVSDPNEIKSIDDLSKSIERGEMLMNSKNFNESHNFNKDNARDTINSLNEILPDNLDSFSEQQNYVALDNDLANNNNSMDNDNSHDFSCIDSDLQFFTKSMSDDVKKYYEEQQLNDARELEQFCPTSTSLDTSFNMTLLDTKSTHLSDPITDAYNTLNPPDLSRNEDCFDFESQLPNPTDYKDETLDYLISSSKQNNSKINYDDEKQAQERDKIINDLMNIESNINTKDRTDIIRMISNDEAYEKPLGKPITDDIDQIKDRSNEKENVTFITSCGVHIQNKTESSYEDEICAIHEVVDSKLLQSSVSESTCEDTLKVKSEKSYTIDKTNNDNEELVKNKVINEKDTTDTANENIPFAVGLLPLKQVQSKKEKCSLKRKSQESDFMNNVDSKCLKRKMKHKKK